MMPVDAVHTVPVTKIDAAAHRTETDDVLAAEEPLEIRLAFGQPSHPQVQNVAVTMRTPGNDAELATGFLFTEGIIQQAADIVDCHQALFACAENRENTVQIDLAPGVNPNLQKAARNFYTTSSCGVCGKSSIDAIRTVSSYQPEKGAALITVDPALFHQLPERLRIHQQIFATTGGLHASALFNLQGELLLMREDVGRHNALDKLIGAALQSQWLPLNQHILLLSGRASFELIQKAAMAGISIVAAVGAPSSLAVQLAQEFNITLIGFLRNQRFNIYTVPQRVAVI